MKQPTKLYCSLDIETSGFDPAANEILEVGFVMFEIGDKKLEIVKEWSQVFKASKPVQPGILGLTGITQKELDEAPSFAEHRDFLQNELGEAVILGHNISFDLKFLEAFGLKFSGETIDTLDLVQFILPTHHSYNLENLMHTFSIKHPNAHRALEDSKATLKVFEKLLKVYNSFPKELKVKIRSLIQLFNLPWEVFLDTDLVAEKFIANSVAVGSERVKIATKAKKIELEKNTICDFSPGYDYFESLVNLLRQQKELALLVLPKQHQVIDFWRQGLVEPVLNPEILFSKKKFEGFLKRPNLTLEETKFLLKILVWQATNWQNQTIIDLNLSFFGGQFREDITGGKIKKTSRSKLLACDANTFLLLSEAKLHKNRIVVVAGVSEFESAISFNIGSRVAWGYVSYLFKSIYNPEINTGNIKLKDVIVEALAATDLFFGLTSALLQSNPPGFINFKVTSDTEFSPQYQKIKKAAENFIDKLLGLNKKIKSKDIAKNLDNLKNFFDSQSNRVKWIELSENRCTFYNSPLDISDLVKGALKPFKGTVFVDALGIKKLWQYYSVRLGLQDFKSKNFNIAQPQVAVDLFTPTESKQLNLFTEARQPSGEELAQLIKSQPMPTAVLFGGSMQVKQFYEQNYEQLKEQASVLSQTNSGGSNKLIRNFRINRRTVLLATDKFILKQSASPSGNEFGALPVSTLIICHLPFEQFTHPYQEALSAQFANPFEEYSLPRAIFNLHSILKFFYTPALKNLYFFDSKLNKGYWNSFLEYLSKLPGIKLM